MIHVFKNNGYAMCLDVNSGSVHVVDDIVYAVLSCMQDGLDREQTAAALVEQGFDPADTSPGTAEQVVAKDERQRLREAISLLPDEQREALILTQLEKVPYEEAARALGVSEGTVKSRVNRAKTRLKELLSEERELSPPGSVQKNERRPRS